MPDDADKTWVAESRKSWGVSQLHDSDAVYRMLRNWHGDPLDREPIAVWSVRGYSGGRQWTVDADEIITEAWYLVDGDDLAAALEAVGQIDLAIEDVLVDHDTDRETALSKPLR